MTTRLAFLTCSDRLQPLGGSHPEPGEHLPIFVTESRRNLKDGGDTASIGSNCRINVACIRSKRGKKKNKKEV